MRESRFPATLSLAAGLLLAGCASTPTEGSAESSAETKTAAPEIGRKSEPAPEKVSEKAPAAKSSRDSEREAPAPAVRSEAKDDGANSPARLIAQLNEATREIATLRAANAKLKAGGPAPAPVSAARDSDPIDDKLAGKVKSFTQFKQELAGVFAEAEKLRAENAALTAQMKDASSGSREVKATIAKLESELKAEKAARAQAEQATAKLREQLRAVASAVSGAGLGGESASGGESRSRGSAAAARKHVLKDGETLEKLADRYLGDATKWRAILEANRGRLPLDGTLPSGLELDIPAK